ncbi:S4 domain-containing protein YaaA [Caldalkalibacillus salinus]|uniref:S4 domain-containing protein YaaA n=1 Tax=Caldalkalibacillus salinus TaxID=2803787 RepID=UPI001924BA6B|nr:S4 domain-containing protein YaaA [Caldalkalibacillus salinus]
MAKQIPITTDYIPLGQFLKLADVLQTGGQVKWFLEEHDVLVNGESENRRGKKLYPGDIIEVEEMGSFEVVQEG